MRAECHWTWTDEVGVIESSSGLCGKCGLLGELVEGVLVVVCGGAQCGRHRRRRVDELWPGRVAGSGCTGTTWMVPSMPPSVTPCPSGAEARTDTVILAAHPRSDTRPAIFAAIVRCLPRALKEYRLLTPARSCASTAARSARRTYPKRVARRPRSAPQPVAHLTAGVERGRHAGERWGHSAPPGAVRGVTAFPGAAGGAPATTHRPSANGEWSCH